jgi:predicted ATPase
MKKIVITGGPCSGKTAVINELYRQGYSTLDETAKEIVAARRQIPVSNEESLIRQELIFNHQLYKENTANESGLLFLDRALPDGIGYSLLYSRENLITKHLEIARKMEYHKIFCLELLPFDSEGFRSANENEEEAMKIQDSILELYRELNYKPIFVPKMSVEERVDFILDRI